MKKKVFKILVLTLVVLNMFYFSYPQKTVETANRFNIFAPRSLYWGSSGQDVKTVQDKLLRWKYYDGSVDGIYGARTYRAVRRFQQKNGLNADGVVGPSTAQAMGINTTSSSSAGSTQGVNRNADEYLLARTIHGEARGEPYIGKVAVAAVVLNRVKSPSFPNTPAGVVYQPLAFTAVADGQINLTPNKDAINAARDALNGWDPTNGCLYYWNPATATSKWIWSRKVTLKIGKHWFGI
ncbi:spore cortex-lytic enzyme [Tissierella creatinophila]|uniref:Spore cortex-lytic enzyme n=1 Tax=Tissierella creatinophila DSM 6911 TaxID=1123403 RepID=A0A1U7M4U0_TISCR|nr:spore cortex-lytic enzyme [Tissierella creatinophila]OLS02270.1 spore cortex-lytic enzyme precursor [Tissierella creatinophila DSM 6911]